MDASFAFGNDVRTPTAQLTLNGVKGKQGILVGDVHFNFTSVKLQLSQNPQDNRRMVVTNIATVPVNINTPIGAQPAAPELMKGFGNQKFHAQAEVVVRSILQANGLNLAGFGFGIQALPGITTPQPGDLRIRIAMKA